MSGTLRSENKIQPRVAEIAKFHRHSNVVIGCFGYILKRSTNPSPVSIIVWQVTEMNVDNSSAYHIGCCEAFK